MRMENLKEIIKWGLAVLFICFALFGGKLSLRFGRQEESVPAKDTIYIRDTIRVYEPIPADSIRSGSIKAVLPAVPVPVPEVRRNFTEVAELPEIDSVLVEIPIVQKKYEDSTYTAYISGYQAKLDSIFIYSKNSQVRIRDEPKRWSIAVQAGYGVSRYGLQPYIGIGICYNLFSF